MAVIGAGVVGMATAKALLAAGLDVRCFERAEPGGGQSAGATRLFRHCHESDGLVLLAVLARKAWIRWQDEVARRLVGDEGVLRFGPDLESAAERLSAAAVPFEFLDPPAQVAALPGLSSPAERALLEPTAGAIRARRAIDLLKASVAPTLVRAEVLGVEEAPGDGYHLLVPDGLWRCERVVLCAGTETARLAAQLGIDIPVVLRCHPRATFTIREEARGSPFACLQDGSGHHGETVYGSPLGRSGQYALGLVGPTSDTPFDAAPGQVPSDLATTPLIERIVRYVDVALKALDPQPVAVRICQSSKLEQGNDAFAAWCERGLTAIAGNNLFKFAPVLGELLSEAALIGRVPEPLHAAGSTVEVSSS